MKKEVLIDIILNDINELKAISEELKNGNPTAAIEVDIALSKAVLVAQQLQLVKEKMGIAAFRTTTMATASPVVNEVILPDIAEAIPPNATDDASPVGSEEEENPVLDEEMEEEDFQDEENEEPEIEVEYPTATIEFEIDPPASIQKVEIEDEDEDEDIDEEDNDEDIPSEEIEEDENEDFSDEEDLEEEEVTEELEEEELPVVEEPEFEVKSANETEEELEDEISEEEEEEEEPEEEETEEEEASSDDDEIIEEDEQEEEEEVHQKTVGEAYHQKSVNDTVDKKSTLDEKIGNGPINSLHASIGVNDRFLFIREVFNNDADLYATAIETIDRCKDIREAADYLSANFRIKRTDASLKFVDLIKRRFTK